MVMGWRRALVSVFGAAVVCGLPLTSQAQVVSRLVPIAAGDMPAPGVPDGRFLSGTSVFRRPVLNDAGEIAFYGVIGRAGDPDAFFEGIWAGRPESLRLVVLTRQPVPGLPAGVQFRSFSPPILDDAGCVLFSARLFQGPDVDENNEDTLWKECSGALQLVARQGSQAPGLPAGVRLSHLGSLIASRSGRISFDALLDGPGVGPANDLAVFTGLPGALELLARRGDPLPAEPAGPAMTSVFPDLINRPGASVLRAGFAAPGAESARRAFLLGRPGDLELIAREGDPVPGGTIEDGELRGAALNDAGQVAFVAELSTLPSALFMGRPGSLRLVASRSDSGLSGAALNAFGEIAFSDGSSIWAGSPDSLRRIATEGEGALVEDPDLADASRGRSFRWGFNDAGQVGFTSQIHGQISGLPLDFFYDSLWVDGALVARTRELLEFPGLPPALIARFGAAAMNNAGQVITVVSTSSTRTPEAVGLWGSPAPPGDGDGIDAPVDGRVEGGFIDESAAFTNAFTDQHRGGSSFGSIVDRSDLTVVVRDAIASTEGLLVAASAGGSGTAIVHSCVGDLPVALTLGDSAVITCGSLTMEVLAGPVEIVLGPSLVITVSEGATATVVDLGAGTFSIANAGSAGTIEIAEGGVVTTLAPGETRVVSVAQNQPPVADAGADRIAEATSPAGASVTLDGSGSGDPDAEDTLAYLWHGPFGEAVGVSPTVEMPLGTSTILLTVTDPAGATATDTVRVTVRDSTAPVITASLERVGSRHGHGTRLRIHFGASDAVDPTPQVTGALLVTGLPDPVPVQDGQTIVFTRADRVKLRWKKGVLEIKAPGLALRVTATDASGGSATTEVTPPDGHDHGDECGDDQDGGGDP